MKTIKVDYIMENTIDLILVDNKEKNNISEDILKALKPGGYIFSFDTPNKAHNTVCDIEDIGFIVKDSISYFFKENEDVKQDVVCLAMKPLSEKNFADNVMRWGTSGLNIDGCRVGNENILINGGGKKWRKNGAEIEYVEAINETREGRFPANLILHKDVAPILDEQSGYSKSKKSMQKVKGSNKNCYGEYNTSTMKEYGVNDERGASRYFKNVNSYKELLKYIAIMGLPPKKGKIMFIGFDNADEIIKEINNENGTSYETVGGMN